MKALRQALLLVMLTAAALIANAQLNGSANASQGARFAPGKWDVRDGLSSTEQSLVGTWQSEGKDAPPVVITFNPDGTYLLKARLNLADAEGKAALRDVTNLGRWSASLEMFSTVITQSADGKPMASGAPGALAINAIRELSNNRFVYQNVANGATFAFTRTSN